jgi:CspA family cold shock protein
MSSSATRRARLVGGVQWFDATRGFGFIGRDDGGPDVFVHARQVREAGLDTLREGQRLEFELGTSRDGRPRAENLLEISSARQPVTAATAQPTGAP